MTSPAFGDDDLWPRGFWTDPVDGSTRHMDPPDGGNPTLSEQVRRMRTESETLAKALTTACAHFNRIRRAIYADDMAVLAREGAEESAAVLNALGLPPFGAVASGYARVEDGR